MAGPGYDRLAFHIAVAVRCSYGMNSSTNLAIRISVLTVRSREGMQTTSGLGELGTLNVRLSMPAHVIIHLTVARSVRWYK